MSEFNHIKWKLIDTLLKIPGMNAYQVRSTLLEDLPDSSLVRDEHLARHDLDEIISGLEKLGRLNDQGGTRPLIAVIDNALHYVSVGGDIANALNEVKLELDQYYGGDAQPELPPLSSGQQEALVFGRQRDTRLPLAFIEGALRTSKSIARLSVPRVFNGVRRKGEDEYSFGTGWLIASGLIITNHHVIEARDRRPKPLGRGEAPAHPEDFEAQAKQVVVWFDYQVESGPHLTCQNATLIARSKQLDYVILQLAEAAKVANRAPLRITREQPVLERSSRLNIAQHSGGGALQYAIRNNFFVQPAEKPDFILYQTDTEPGASGSPVCDDLWHVVALHHASRPVSPGPVPPQEVIDGNPVIVTLLNEAIAIHSILNSLPVEVRQQIMDAQQAQGWT